MAISIQEITAENFVDAIRLKVAPEQEQYVATNAASIAQSKFHTFLACYGTYDGETMVGFSAFDKHPENGTAWIVRYMTGAQYQRQGFGKIRLHAVLGHMRKEYDCPSVYLDVGPENIAAIKLYEDAGQERDLSS